MFFNKNKRKRLHNNRVKFPEDLVGAPTWPPFLCLGHQHGGRDVMWKPRIFRRADFPQFTFFPMFAPQHNTWLICMTIWKPTWRLSWIRPIREPNSINEHVYIPDIYKALGNPKWRFYGFLSTHFVFVSHFMLKKVIVFWPKGPFYISFLVSDNKFF